MTTGELIRMLRLQKGLSQEELGGMVGVKKAAINKYENGIVVNLKRSIIAKLAQALDVEPVFLLGFEGNQKPATIENDSGHTPYKSALIDVVKELDEDSAKALLEIVRQVKSLRDQ